MVFMSGRSFGKRNTANRVEPAGAMAGETVMEAKASDPLDGMWLLKAGEKLFGPYTGHQMCRFKTEGRLSAQSMISRMGTTPSEAHWHTAASDTVLGVLFRGASGTGVTFGVKSENAGAKFVIVLDLKGGHSNLLEEEIYKLGSALRLTSQLWLVTGPHTVNSIRNQLSRYLGPLDWLLVIDATQARTGGFNMGPEIDSQIRSVWQG